MLPSAGQYISFDSSHIWETGIQTYIAGLQHLPISQTGIETVSTTGMTPPLLLTPPLTVTQSLQEHANKPTQLPPTGASHDVAPPPDEHSPDARHSTTQPYAQTASARSSDATTDNLWELSDMGKSVYISLAPHNGSAIDSFLQGVPDASEWEVYVFQVLLNAAQDLNTAKFQEVVKQWQGEVNEFVTFTQAAGIAFCRLPEGKAKQAQH